MTHEPPMEGGFFSIEEAEPRLANDGGATNSLK